MLESTSREQSKDSRSMRILADFCSKAADCGKSAGTVGSRSRRSLLRATGNSFQSTSAFAENRERVLEGQQRLLYTYFHVLE